MWWQQIEVLLLGNVTLNLASLTTTKSLHTIPSTTNEGDAQCTKKIYKQNDQHNYYHPQQQQPTSLLCLPHKHTMCYYLRIFLHNKRDARQNPLVHWVTRLQRRQEDKRGTAERRHIHRTIVQIGIMPQVPNTGWLPRRFRFYSPDI